MLLLIVCIVKEKRFLWQDKAFLLSTRKIPCIHHIILPQHIAMQADQLVLCNWYASPIQLTKFDYKVWLHAGVSFTLKYLRVKQ